MTKKFPLVMLFLGVIGTLSATVGESSGASPNEQNIYVNLAKKVVPSVVNISTLSTVKSPYVQGGDGDLFRRFFEEFFKQHNGGMGPRGGGGDEGDEDDGGPGLAPGPQNPPRKLPKAMSLGTGFIIDASGVILTNNHVVADADEIKINFTEDNDEKATDGEVVGRDAELDVALIKVKSKREMIPIGLGDSDALEVGEYVMAVGNPFGQGHSVTHGIISAKGRKSPDFPLANYLQTDAPINPGNSGGPLVNLKGEVIGINNAIDQRAQGIGFAIPINAVKAILSQLKTKGTVARGYIGVLVNELSPEVATQMGVDKNVTAPFVTHVYPGEPADKAGIKPYDVILEFNGKPVHSSSDLIGAVTSVKVGDTVPVKVLRGKESKSLQITVSERPGADKMAKKDAKKPSKEKLPSRVDTGMKLEELTPDTAKELGMPDKSSGVVVSSITYGGPSDKAGLTRGDVILEVDRKPVKDVESFYSHVKAKKSYLLRVRRPDPHGGEVFMVIVLNLKD